MNILTITTNPTEEPLVFDACWMTGLIHKGRVRVTVPQLDDSRTAAELVAIQYLLVERNVAGHNKAGAGLIIKTSCSTIMDLVEASSSKSYLSPYANFLRTRFLGAVVEHEEGPYTWADELCEQEVDYVIAGKPSLTTIEVAGIGPVELTAHAVKKYIQRFDRKPVKAWREFIRIGRDAKLSERTGKWRVFHDLKHRRPARYFVDPKREVVLVITEPDHPGMLPRLVTTYRSDTTSRITEC